MKDTHQPSPSDVTRILGEVRRGERNASSRLLPLVYDALRRLARARMADLPPGQTLQPTALVHDAYLRLVGDEDVAWKDRAHFFGAAAIAMRDILVERARRRSRVKHGGEMRRVELDDSRVRAGILVPAASGEGQELDMIALNDALGRLEAEDPRKSQIVMLRYFAGLSIEDTAAALELSPATVKREWVYAKAWLLDALDTPRSASRNPLHRSGRATHEAVRNGSEDEHEPQRPGGGRASARRGDPA